MIIREKEFNAATGEEIITEREETSTEIEVREKREMNLLAAEAEAEAKAQAKAQVLAQLGITEEQAKLLLS